MNREREIQEAIRAAEDALRALDRADDELGKAGGWGMVDLLGGGTFTTFLKRSKMDQARKAMQEADYAMRRLSRELSDVNRFERVDLPMGDFMGFADYFFDGFLADALVQSQISSARKQVRRTRAQVERTLSDLRRM